MPSLLSPESDCSSCWSPHSLPLPPPLQIMNCLSTQAMLFCASSSVSSQSLLHPSATPANQSLLSPTSPSVPQLSLSGMDPSKVCREPAPIGCMDPLALPLAADPVTPSWPIALTPLLLPPLAPQGTSGLTAPTGSFGPSPPPSSD